MCVCFSISFCFHQQISVCSCGSNPQIHSHIHTRAETLKEACTRGESHTIHMWIDAQNKRGTERERKRKKEKEEEEEEGGEGVRKNAYVTHVWMCWPITHPHLCQKSSLRNESRIGSWSHVYMITHTHQLTGGIGMNFPKPHNQTEESRQRQKQKRNGE